MYVKIRGPPQSPTKKADWLPPQKAKQKKAKKGKKRQIKAKGSSYGQSCIKRTIFSRKDLENDSYRLHSCHNSLKNDFTHVLLPEKPSNDQKCRNCLYWTTKSKKNVFIPKRNADFLMFVAWKILQIGVRTTFLPWKTLPYFNRTCLWRQKKAKKAIFLKIEKKKKSWTVA